MRRCAWMLLALVAAGCDAATLDQFDELVAAGVATIHADAGTQDVAGYGVVFSGTGVIIAPAALCPDSGKVAVGYGGERYLAEVEIRDPRGLAVLRCALSDAFTIPVGSVLSLQIGDPVRVLQPVAGGWQPVEARILTNGVRRVGRIKARVVELDLPPSGQALGLPVYLPESGQVIGLVGFGQGVGEGVNLLVSALDTASNLVVDRGLKIEPRLRLDTDAVVDASGRLLDRFVESWHFPFGATQPSPRERSALEYFQGVYGRFPDPLTEPAIAGNELFLGERWGGMYKLLISDQRRSWRSDDPGLMIFYPPVLGLDQLLVAAGEIWNDQHVSYADLAAQSLMWQAQDKLGGPLAIFGQHSRRQVGKEPLTIEQRVLHFALYGAGALVALDRQTGREQWRLPTGFIGEPKVVGEQVYFGGLGIRGSAQLGDGTLRWAADEHLGKREATRNTWWYLAYASEQRLLYLAVPLWYGYQRDDRLHGSGQCYLIEVDPATGKKRSEHDLFRLSYDARNAERPLATYSVLDRAGTADETLYCLVGQNLFSVKPASGEFQALQGLEDKTGKRGFSNEMAVADGILFIGTTDRRLLALDGGTGQGVWAQTPELKGAVGSPMVEEGRVYVGSSDGYLHVFAALDGRELWYYEVGGKVVGQPVVIHGPDQDTLYVALDNGRLTAIRLPSQ